MVFRTARRFGISHPVPHYLSYRGMCFGISLIVFLISAHIACEQQVKPYRSARVSGGEASCTVNQQTVGSAVQAYRLTHGGAMPSSLDDLVESGRLRNYPRCPEDGTPYGYDPETGVVTCPNHPPH